LTDFIFESVEISSSLSKVAGIPTVNRHGKYFFSDASVAERLPPRPIPGPAEPESQGRTRLDVLSNEPADVPIESEESAFSTPGDVPVIDSKEHREE
jgi:hypothetical protein